MSIQPFFDELNTCGQVSSDSAELFRKDGYVVIRSVFSSSFMALLRRRCDEAIRDVAWQSGSKDAYRRAFRYKMNPRLEDPIIAHLSQSQTLSEIAAQLLGVDGMRLSHDQLLYKPPGGAPTPPHADQFHWPIGDEDALTAWIPLQTTPPEMGALAFYPGSQRMADTTRIRLSNNDSALAVDRELRSVYSMDGPSYEIGDLSFHRGWTFHSTDGNSSSETRAALSIVYFKDGIRLTAPQSGTPIEALHEWSPGIHIGDLLDSGRHPLISVNQRRASQNLN